MSNVIEINEGEFSLKVIEESNKNLVLVDFWAPWCGPCKQLTPILEKVTNKAKGKVKLVKINIDENQQIAAQLRIQSIPAVFAFKDGQPIDAFQGVIPENKIEEFIEKNIGEKLNKDNSSFYNQIQDMISNEEYQDALNKLEEFIASQPEDLRSISLYIECFTHLNKYDEAENFYNSLNKESQNDKFIKSAYQKLKIKEKNKEGPSLENLKQKFQYDQNNINNITKLADKYFSENMFDECFVLLLDNYKNHKDKIKKKLLEFFEALGNEHDKTIEYRRKFSSIIFS